MITFFAFLLALLTLLAFGLIFRDNIKDFFTLRRHYICGYNVLIPKSISLTTKQYIIDIITNAHNKWYFPNKHNINFNNIEFCGSFDMGGKFSFTSTPHYEYTPDYKAAVRYTVLAYYHYPKCNDEDNKNVPLYQDLCNIQITVI